ncbi:MAG: SRPBCC family protein [Acidobacteria bacterium]|nr:SRPBCC family protein [Acidobacteriota bacterium]
MEQFEYSSLILAPVEKVFAFHERADAIQLLTPAIMMPRVTRLRGSGLEAGVELIVTTLAGPWHARHTAYEKNRLFVDEIVEGPMKQWRHEHRFTTEGPYTRLTDSIRFVPKGPAFLVKLGLTGLFWFRHRVTKRWCEGPQA